MGRIGVTNSWRPSICRIPMLLTVLGLAILSLIEARSPHPPPLRRLAHPESSTLEILPRRSSSLNPRYITHLPPHPSSLKHSDTVVLKLSSPELSPLPANLLLRPTEHLFHPDAKVSYGDDTRTELLREEDWRLFTGEVIHPKWIERIKSLESSGHQLGPHNEAIIGSASVMVHHPGDGVDEHTIFEGTFTMYGIRYTVMTRDNYQRVKTLDDVDVEVESLGSQLVVFRDIDMTHSINSTTSNHHHSENKYNLGIGSSCSHDTLPFNSHLTNPILQQPSGGLSGDSYLSNLLPFGLGRRDDTGGMSLGSNFINSIGSNEGCPKEQRIVYMGVALDCNYVAAYQNPDQARTQVLNDWNQISALYKSTFNISLGIIELQVRNMTCPTTPPSGEEWNVPCGNNLTLDERLSRFSAWRGEKGDDGAGLWHLMSACPTDSEVGVAWLGTLCQNTATQQSGQTVSGTGISTATKTEWSLIAHEIGHGFGAIHDCTSGCSLSGSCCPSSSSACDAGGQFIMNPTTSSSEQTFSPCTLGNICSNIGGRTMNTNCITSPGSRTVISLQQCGNGIVEDGEDCDPGGNSTSACCDASTCKFREGAVCDPTNSACCTSSCQLASAGTVCRSSVDATCDFEETCTGTNATCPDDKTAEDGKSCGSDGLACASGRCTSLNQQCRSVGSSMGLTQACGQKDDKSCVVTCRDPNVTNQCVVLQTSLVDGSPCGYGGHCYNQTCNSGSWQATAAAWYTQNLQISIPVTIVVGLIVLGLLWAIVKCTFGVCCVTKTRRPPNMRNNGTRGSAYVPAPTGPPPPPPPHMSQLPPPPPQAMRHSDSIGSGDPLVRDRDMGGVPAPPGQYGYGQQYNNPYANNNQSAYQGQGQGYQQHQQRNSTGWVDASAYNGPNYGYHEAYGR
ncbi:uncharacterized protein I303_104813 [Kwoniella dejecticola CBS 10117]|uniref:Disintegrin and metalloproteinase domain-containing protein B n=1 Tax=Kwoniella dejecticola CBS 10117 TaxID=1296121 RepID=A0A1A6A4A4_9TREE|nr:uncharacterized protein I303_04206 [Kwoniella dejecticola CBS 10117]OBR84884.1 hypothetical protein I303_04206 [Kwoniella dejecticola CBS 10117]